MAKLKDDPIAQADLQEYVENVSDFGFEISVLKLLADKGFHCQHGGSYEDPVTKKTRQFDIRATKALGKNYLHLAVECKNLRENFPLLISCVPRKEDEAFHEICFSANPDKFSLGGATEPYMRAMARRSRNIRLTGERTRYRAGDPVGKSCSQVGRQNHDSTLTANDSEVFDKWSQALASASDLTHRACTDGETLTGDIALSLVFAVVVVPNGRLWATHYDFSGARTRDPFSVEHCPYFVNQSYAHRSSMAWEQYAVSHIDFVTTCGLETVLESMVGSEETLEALFPHEHVIQVIQSGRRRTNEE